MRFVAILIALLCLTLSLPAFAEDVEDFNRGFVAFENGDYAGALRLWRPLADKGLARAQYNLGVMYRDGQGVQQDYKEAVSWYRKAAEQGHMR
jgi:uncharacterized protein